MKKWGYAFIALFMIFSAGCSNDDEDTSDNNEQNEDNVTEVDEEEDTATEEEDQEDESVTEEEREALLTYYNEDVYPLAELEETAISAYENVSGDNYTDDETMHTTITETVLPEYERLVEGLNDIHIEDEELAAVHETYISGAEEQLVGFNKIVEAIETQDEALIDEANENLNNAFEELQEYNQAMFNLIRNRGLEVEGGKLK